MDIVPLAVELQPFWHPLSIIIKLFESFTIENFISSDSLSNSKENGVGPYINDVVKVFSKIFINTVSPESMTTTMQQKYSLLMLNHNLLLFLKTILTNFLSSRHLANLSKLISLRDNQPSFFRKALTTFLHPALNDTGFEISLNMSVLLITLLRLSEWNIDESALLLTNSNIKPIYYDDVLTYESTYSNGSIETETTSDTNQFSSNVDLATSIKQNFKNKLLDNWSKNAFLLSNFIENSEEIKSVFVSSITNTTNNKDSNNNTNNNDENDMTRNNTFSNNNNNNSNDKATSASSSSDTGGQHDYNLRGTILCNLLWSSSVSQSQVFKLLVEDVVTTYFEELGNSKLLGTYGIFVTVQ